MKLKLKTKSIRQKDHKDRKKSWISSKYVSLKIVKKNTEDFNFKNDLPK